MAALARGNTDDARKAAVSPRPKGRENVKETLCRNVTIYGHCRYENKGCSFNHDPTRGNINSENMKKRFNVDSPSFTPSVQSSPSLSVNGLNKSAGISPKAANAAPFRPKQYNGGNETSSYSRNQYNPAAADWSMASEMPEYLPQTQNIVDHDANMNMYNPFGGAISQIGDGSLNMQQNPLAGTSFAPDASQNVPQYFQSAQVEQQPQYHLYASFGPKRENLALYQRAAQDFFIPDDLREDLQRKSHASHQTISMGLGLITVGDYHNLVPLDTNKNNAPGYPNSLFKVNSIKDGKLYALRRLEGFKLTNEMTIQNWKRWKAISNANIVTATDIFTERSAFPDGNSSLCVVTEYHPLSKTLAEKYLQPNQYRGQKTTMPDTNTLWSFVVQIANALRSIHAAGLYARMLEPNKIILTSEKRLRLNTCGIPDIILPDAGSSPIEKQRQDLVQFGSLIATLGVGAQVMKSNNMHMIQEQLRNRHSSLLADKVLWLLNAAPGQSMDNFLESISSQVIANFNASLNYDDEITSNLSRELENSRLVRLMTKINFITERPEHSNSTQWSEVGDRYPIKLFRDYVFHQVHDDGAPSLDLAHVIMCLNKLDAGVDEKMILTTRDEETLIQMSYKEMKRLMISAYDELVTQERRRNTSGY